MHSLGSLHTSNQFKNIIILSFFSTYFAKPTMNHCKNRLLTWIYSVFFTLPIAVTQLKHQKIEKIENLQMFPSKREISRSNGRTGDNLSKQESPFQNGRVRTYALLRKVFVLSPSGKQSSNNCKHKRYSCIFFLS